MDRSPRAIDIPPHLDSAIVNAPKAMMSPVSVGSTDSKGVAHLGKLHENTNVTRSNPSVAEKLLSRVPSLSGIVVLGPEPKHPSESNIDGQSDHGSLFTASESSNGGNDNGQRLPVTPTSQRIANINPRSATKTPTFAKGEKRRKPRTSRRQRAGTPHPSSSGDTSTSGGEIESATTSPQTTPEKPSKPRRKRRYAKKSKTFGSSESESVLESPLVKRSNPFLADEIEEITNDSKEEMSKPSSPAEALIMKIDYPSFQTTAILEFEPDFPQSQTAPPPVAAVDEKLQVTRTKKLIKYKRPFRRFKRPRTLKPLNQRTPVDQGTRPALVILFEKYGVEFSKEKRPYLQYAALETAARQKSEEIVTYALREEFTKAFELDNERDWPQHEIMMSPIDQYFAKNDGKITAFEYNPREEPTSEFIRLSLAAGWIDEVPVWDVANWDKSLEKFEHIWSDPLARKERGKFKEACFYEFDQLLGHIFFDTAGKYPSYQQPSTDTSHEGKIWQLQDYHRFLACFDESALPTIRECKDTIREKLNVNLFDLLNWFRNPDSATRPQRFGTVAELGEYSYVQNKVFPLYTASSSRIANRLLRKIAQFKYQRSYRKRGALLRTSSESPQPVNPEITDNGKGVTGDTTSKITLESTRKVAAFFALPNIVQNENAGAPMKDINRPEKVASQSVGVVTVTA